jgi:hypothetical protein
MPVSCALANRPTANRRENNEHQALPDDPRVSLHANDWSHEEANGPLHAVGASSDACLPIYRAALDG